MYVCMYIRVIHSVTKRKTNLLEIIGKLFKGKDKNVFSNDMIDRFFFFCKERKLLTRLLGEKNTVPHFISKFVKFNVKRKAREEQRLL